MEIIPEQVEKYINRYSSPESPNLSEISEATCRLHPSAHMLSGHIQGKLLSFLSFMLQPKFILEIGSFTGYSAICLSEGLLADGELHTIELREFDAAIAVSNFKKYNNKQINLHVGNAKNIIAQLPHLWDIVFIDADKTGYIDYYEMVLPRLSNRGIIIADNVLFHGQVLEDPITGKNAKAIHAFNEHVKKDTRTEQVLLSVRDGIMIIKKIVNK